tara:strand:- start:15825 stop:16874 length:1050 start_codon:yes stop_codon:yes gene_type:complete
MPIPKPKDGENRQDFINRCMGDNTMEAEYTDTEQRSAVCNNSYDSKGNETEVETQEENTDEKSEIRDDVFTTESEALDRAKEIGCEGSHSHDEDGNKIFMPCNTHEEYIEATGEDVKQEENIVESEHDSIEVKTEIKAVFDEQEVDEGVFEGYGSIFNNTDLGNDVIRNGAFTKSLKKKKPKNVKLLYQHKSDMPIGVFDEISEDQNGLKVKGRLALKTQAGAEAYELMKMGALDGLSIGFKPNPKAVRYDKRKKKRIIEEVELMEISLVTFPMNPEARIRSVKGEDVSKREWENGLRDAFGLSRSEAKVAAKAVYMAFDQRDVDAKAEVVDAINNLTKKFNSWREENG